MNADNIIEHQSSLPSLKQIAALCTINATRKSCKIDGETKDKTSKMILISLTPGTWDDGAIEK